MHLQRQAEEDKNLPSSADPLKGQLVKLIMFFGLVLLLSTIKEAFGEEGVSVPSFHEFKLPVLEFPRELGIKRHFDQSFR